MKDPLDTRDDAYKCFNDEAASQKKPVRIGLASAPVDVRKLFGPLRPRASAPDKLQEAYDRLTHAERRLEEDALFYWVPEDGLVGTVEEPESLWTRDVAVPPMAIEDALLSIPAVDDPLFEPVRVRNVEITLLNRYDEAQLPWPIEFAK